jgi:thiol-disulfide isomerase/thioredoxin
MLVVAGTLALAGVVVVGILAADRGEPSRVSLPDAGDAALVESTPTPAPPAKAEPAKAEPRLKGKGSPIRISGTDPITGEPVSLDDFTGKPVVLAIWASWCSGCNDEAPHLAEVAAARGDVHFVGLNYRDDAGSARGFYEKYGWEFPSIEDSSGGIATGLGLQGTPTTIFLDTQHREIGRILGATDAAGFQDAVAQITAR